MPSVRSCESMLNLVWRRSLSPLKLHAEPRDARRRDRGRPQERAAGAGGQRLLGIRIEDVVHVEESSDATAIQGEGFLGPQIEDVDIGRALGADRLRENRRVAVVQARDERAAERRAGLMTEDRRQPYLV